MINTGQSLDEFMKNMQNGQTPGKVGAGPTNVPSTSHDEAFAAFKTQMGGNPSSKTEVAAPSAPKMK